MPDTPPTATPAPTPAATPSTPAPSPSPNISDAFITSLRVAMDREKNPPPPAPEPEPGAAPVENPRFAGTLGQINKAVSRDPGREVQRVQLGEKRPAATPPAVIPEPAAPTPPVVSKEPPAPATPPAVTPPVDPALADVKKFKITPMPEQIEVKAPPVDKPLLLDISGLNEDEISEMETAMFAERQHPERYAGHAQKVLDFLRKHKAVVIEIEAAGEDDVEDSARYKAFKKNNPQPYSVSERRRLDTERVAVEVSQRARAEVNEELSTLRKQLADTRAAPVVEKTIKDFRAVVESIMPKEDDTLVRETTAAVVQRASHAAQEFLLLSNRLKQYDDKDPVHKWMGDFIEQQAGIFMGSKDPALRRGTQTFVSRAQYNQLPTETRTKHFTFTDEDILQILAANARVVAEETVKRDRTRLEAAGYVRKTSGAPAPRAHVEPDPSPRASASPASGVPNESVNRKDPFLAFMLGSSATS